MKIIFATGGTGGHITPALAVADHLHEQHPSVELLLLCSRKTLDMEILSRHSTKYRFETISTGKLRRYFSWKNFRDIVMFPKGVWEVYRLLRRERPDVIFSKGGYVGLPVGIAARFLKIPIVLHESDVSLGLSNRLLQKIATTTLTTFPGKEGQWVGTPIRREILNGSEKKGRTFLGFPQNKKIILVVGGSQGAENINQLLLHALSGLQQKAALVHLTGKGKSAAGDSRFYRSFSYLDKEYADVLAAATIVISRAGANALFEFAATKKPVLLVPLPSAANDHQRKNAKFFAERQAAKVLDETGLTSAQFQKVILEFLADTAGQKELSESIGKLVQDDAAEKIVKVLLACGNPQRKSES